MEVPPLTTEQKYAVIQRAFLSRKGTRAMYESLAIKPPCFMALTYLGRVKQFYRRTGMKWPWRD
jgi:hypothetical protein